MPGESIGEFALIDRIVARLGEAAARTILVPSGDDAAVWAAPPGAVVATTDALVEGNHWRADTMSMADVGWRAVASNVSDIAAMGATPEQALLVAVLAPSMGIEQIDAFIDGVAEACLAHGLRVAGGDIVRGSQTAFVVTVLGRAGLQDDGAARVLRRDAARVGDAVAVSGHPGAAAAGLAVIEAGRESDPEAGLLLLAHRRPRARLALGQAALDAGVRCALDISDGTLQDLGHIAERSGVGVELRLDALPLHPAAVALLGRGRACDLALGGGEDYELALAGPPEALAALSTPELPVTVVGRVVAEHPGEAWALSADGSRYRPPSEGWDQLRSGTTDGAGR